MKRFPPITNPGTTEHRIKTVNVPYANLYKKALNNNPLFADETVHGAFAHLEPKALVMAKRQYKFMQEGMDEQSALNKAMEYVNEVENDSYLALKHAVNAVKSTGTAAPFVADATVSAEIATWQAKVLETPYEEMDLGEQGELDHFVQTKLLKWNEVERSRRMKDVMFVQQFELLLSSLFPISAEKVALKRKAFQTEFKESFLNYYELDPVHMNTTKPFYIEEYLSYYAKVKAQPDLNLWDVREREVFSRWIVDTLAYGSALINRTAGQMQHYLDAVRERFFPMVRLPFQAVGMRTPTADDVKGALYTNEVGYKLQDGKTFVKRFYRIPALLFPVELLVAQIAGDKERLALVLEDNAGLAKELAAAGIDEIRIDEIRRSLERYRDYAASLPVEEEEDSDLGLSVLDEILRDSKGLDNTANFSMDDELVADEEQDEQFIEAIRYGSPEWKTMVDKHFTMPTTDLEKEKFEFFNLVETVDLEGVTSEEDVIDFKEARIQSEVLTQAKLQRRYDAKDAARRRKDWERRNLWELSLPNAPLING